MADPTYKRIADQLQAQIEAGKWAPGEQLPTEPELRVLFDNASRNTVRDAIKLLISRNLVETRPGRGTFVLDKIDPFVTTLSGTPGSGFGGGEGAAYLSEVTAKQREPSVTEPRVEIQKSDGKVSGYLRITEGTEVISRHQERRIDGKPWSLQTTWYPMSFVQRGAIRLIQAENIKEGAVAYLHAQLGIEQVGYQDLLIVRRPDPNEATFFRLPDDGTVAVVEHSRTAYGQEGLPFRLTITVFPADRNRFIFNAGKLPDDVVQKAGAPDT
ncbi:MAG TPA: GntR family transcriptional regulator [Streptosporangiaceae bacterium]|nr:GntR family transcriptional regulator [Streptosporangiaceae bacterium]